MSRANTKGDRIKFNECPIEATSKELKKIIVEAIRSRLHHYQTIIQNTKSRKPVKSRKNTQNSSNLIKSMQISKKLPDTCPSRTINMGSRSVRIETRSKKTYRPLSSQLGIPRSNRNRNLIFNYMTPHISAVSQLTLFTTQAERLTPSPCVSNSDMQRLDTHPQQCIQLIRSHRIQPQRSPQRIADFQRKIIKIQRFWRAYKTKKIIAYYINALSGLPETQASSMTTVLASEGQLQQGMPQYLQTAQQHEVRSGSSAYHTPRKQQQDVQDAGIVFVDPQSASQVSGLGIQQQPVNEQTEEEYIMQPCVDDRLPRGVRMSCLEQMDKMAKLHKTHIDNKNTEEMQFLQQQYESGVITLQQYEQEMSNLRKWSEYQSQRMVKFEMDIMNLHSQADSIMQQVMPLSSSLNTHIHRSVSDPFFKLNPHYVKEQTKQKRQMTDDEALAFCEQLQADMLKEAIKQMMGSGIIRAQLKTMAGAITKPKGIRTDMVVVQSFVAKFIEFVMSQLRYIGNLSKLARYSPINQPIISLNAFEQFDRHITTRLTLAPYYDDPTLQQDRITFIKSAISTHNRAIFDCLNEQLQTRRRMAPMHQKIDWSLRQLKKYNSKYSISHAIADSQSGVMDSQKVYCGLLPQKLPKKMLKQLDGVRQQRMTESIALEMRQSNKQWIGNDIEHCQIFKELCLQIMSHELNEAIRDIISI